MDSHAKSRLQVISNQLNSGKDLKVMWKDHFIFKLLTVYIVLKNVMLGSSCNTSNNFLLIIIQLVASVLMF